MHIRHLYLAAALAATVSLAPAAYAHGAYTAQGFVSKASVANEFEIETSQLALEKSENSDVKSFAQSMIDDHKKTGEKLKDVLASSKSNAKPADGLDDKHQKLLDKLQSASGKDFDSQYIAIQKDAHKEAVGLFSGYSKHGKDANLKEFASETLPTLQDHMKHVEQLKAND